MRIIAKRTLVEYAASISGKREQSSLMSALNEWYSVTNRSDWRTSDDVRASFSYVSVITAERYVFNIKGNHYRLVATVNFPARIVYVKWLGTHAEYDEIDVRRVEHDT